MNSDKVINVFLVFMRLAAASCVLAAAALLMLFGDDLFGLWLAKFMFVFIPALIWYTFSRLKASGFRQSCDDPVMLAVAAA